MIVELDPLTFIALLVIFGGLCLKFVPRVKQGTEYHMEVDDMVVPDLQDRPSLNGDDDA